jgi:hypothetical protein
MRRLVIFVHGDFTLLENGSHVRMAQLVDFMRAALPHLSVYSHRQHPSHAWTEAAERRFRTMFPDVELVLEHAPPALRALTRLKNAVLALLPGAVGQVVRWSLPGATPRWRALSRGGGHLLMVNFVDGYTVLNGVCCDSVIETHDVRFVKQAKRYGRPVYHPRMLGKMRSELALLSRARAAVAISAADATLFRSLLPELRLFEIPSYERGEPPPRAASAPTHDLLFVGANNNFNVDGVVGFLTANRGWLEGRRVTLAGRVCEAPQVRQLAAAWPSLELLGFVEDLAPVYARTRLVLAPVEGTGLKIKVVEALAHGKPVAGSAHARDGLPPGHEGCMFAMDRETITRLLDDPAALAKAGREALRYHAGLAASADRTALVDFLLDLLRSPACP